jgi:hypothetical protein
VRASRLTRSRIDRNCRYGSYGDSEGGRNPSAHLSPLSVDDVPEAIFAHHKARVHSDLGGEDVAVSAFVVGWRARWQSQTGGERPHDEALDRSPHQRPARRLGDGFQIDRIVALARRNKPSVDFCGYWPQVRFV